MKLKIDVRCNLTAYCLFSRIVPFFALSFSLPFSVVVGVVSLFTAFVLCLFNGVRFPVISHTMLDHLVCIRTFIYRLPYLKCFFFFIFACFIFTIHRYNNACASMEIGVGVYIYRAYVFIRECVKHVIKNRNFVTLIIRAHMQNA